MARNRSRNKDFASQGAAPLENRGWRRSSCCRGWARRPQRRVAAAATVGLQRLLRRST